MATENSLLRAYASCESMARKHYENFPVASWLLPKSVRPHISAVYAFARCADDFADEGTRSNSERLDLLEEWESRLFQCQTSGASNQCMFPRRPCDPDEQLTQDVFLALGNTINRYGLPVALFQNLLSAFRQDVTQHRYEQWSDLLDYCCRSANPIGRIVLRIAGPLDDRLEQASDNLCSALQITNLLQDFDSDWKKGRLYVPLEIYEVHGAKIADLDDMSLKLEWREAIRNCIDRTRLLFADGKRVCDHVDRLLKFELRMTWLGGMHILDRLEKFDCDPVSRRPTVRGADVLPLLLKSLIWL